MRPVTRKRRRAETPTRAQQLFDQQWSANARRTDRMFAVLMLLQWIAAIVVALTLSPKTWQGAQSHIHTHVWLALGLGGVLASLPIYLAWRHSGQTLTRHVIAIAQVLFSSLLIHVSGGRIETHFHIFGSLAFLAFYRDWKVLVPATAVVAVDHLVRGMFWPDTVFGIVSVQPWRWMEHAGWVLYEDLFLMISCRNGVREMWSSAARTAELESINREMKERTRELELAVQSNRAIVEAALDAVIGMDREGRIIAWNPQAEATFGYREEEVRGRSLADMIIPERYRQSHARGLTHYLETGQRHLINRRVEVAAVDQRGREFPVELAIAAIESNSSTTFCAFVRDITQPKQAADALRFAKEAAEAANYAKSAFLANMSHEIRTPLNGILGFADILLQDIDGDVRERRDHLQTIHDSGRHLLTLINDILDLSKIESGQMEVERVRCSPHEVIAEVMSILRVRAQERGLSLEYFWKSQIPATIETDPMRLRQILMNLIGNAIKFTEVGGVQVAARLQSDEHPRLVIDVIDTGAGIAAESLERIFEPFVQADISITRRFGGTGLGLSISRRLARLLGGDLTVNSEPGRGSIFTATIETGSLDGVPLSYGSAADVVRSEQPPAGQTRRELPPCRILVVEDGVTNRKLISLILERAGARVETAENGQAGLDAVSWQTFDLILMDMQMPVMDGYTATRELRQSGCTTPIVALTAHAMKGDEQKCREAGCSGYLTKPIDPQRLLNCVSDALASSPHQQPESRPSACESPATSAAQRIASSLDIEDEDFREIVEEFIVRMDEKLAELREAARQNDLRQVAEIAHWIKGSGGTAGFDVFTAPAARLERLAKADSSAAVDEEIDQLVALTRRIERPKTAAAAAAS